MITSALGEETTLETYSLVWLDAGVGLTDNLVTKHKLRALINHVEVFQQSDQCAKYIQSLSKHERVVLITNDQLGQQLVPKIHSFRQISSVYVYNTNEHGDKNWSKPFYKVN